MADELVERRCEHGVRWPHPCDDCHEESLKPHNLIARITRLTEANAAQAREIDVLKTALAVAVSRETTDTEVEDALVSEGIHVWGSDGERFDRMFSVVMNLRSFAADRALTGGPHD